MANNFEVLLWVFFVVVCLVFFSPYICLEPVKTTKYEVAVEGSYPVLFYSRFPNLWLNVLCIAYAFCLQ